MSIDLGRRLIAAGLVSAEEAEAALFFSVARGVPFARVLIDRGAITERGVEEELTRLGGLGLRQVSGAAELVARLPRAMCRRLAAVPTRVDTATGAVDVAAADPLDPHIAAEFGFHLGAPIRVLMAPIGAVEEAIRRLELDEPDDNAQARPRRVTPPFPHGAPQSSIPPPVLEETPIPLVRKIPGAPESERRPNQPARPVAVIRPIVAPGYDAGSAPIPLSTPQRRPAAARRAPGEPPAVSFPSTPPAAANDRVTPAYGTPLAELGVLANAPGSDASGYRIAPPEDEAARAPEPAPREDPPASQLPFGASPEARTVPAMLGPRRPARPAIGEGSYPGYPGARQPPGSVRAALPDEDAEDEPPPPPEPRRVRVVALEPLVEALQRATERDEVIRVAMRGMRLVARRLGVFVVRRDGFRGWMCNVDLGDPDAFGELTIPADQPSVLATATATAMYLGPIPSTPAHEGLLRVMERASPDVAAIAVRVSGRPVLVLLSDDLEDTLTGTRFLGDLARVVGEALARLIAR